MTRTHTVVERLSIAAASVALSIVTLATLVVAPSRTTADEAIAAKASPAYAVVDVRYVSYEPATRIN